MLSKKAYKVIATDLGGLEDCAHTESVVTVLCRLFVGDNPRFDENRFREWIRRIRAGESTKGLE